MTWWSFGAWFIACMGVLAFPARAVEYRLQVANMDCLDRAGLFGAARDAPAVHEHARVFTGSLDGNAHGAAVDRLRLCSTRRNSGMSRLQGVTRCGREL